MLLARIQPYRRRLRETPRKRNTDEDSICVAAREVRTILEGTDTAGPPSGETLFRLTGAVCLRLNEVARELKEVQEKVHEVKLSVEKSVS